MTELAYLGPQGTNSEEAAKYMVEQLDNSYKLIPCKSIYEAITLVAEGKFSNCLVPIENSIEGSVRITLDTLAHEENLLILRELQWRVHNQLLVKDINEPIHTIISHEQPLAQCRQFLQQNYPGTRLTAVESTAKAAELISQLGSGYAAIATSSAANLYGLSVLQYDIQDVAANFTRFVLIGNKNQAISDLKAVADKMLLICQIDGKAGSLYELLGEFALRKINMTRIESRPSRTCPGEYIFFIEIEPITSKEVIEDGLQAIQKQCLWIKNLGLFPVISSGDCTE